MEQTGVSINAVDIDGTTPLISACGNGCPDALDICNFLLEKGANINMIQITWGWTALISACNSGIPSVMKRLLQYKDLEVSTIHHIDKEGYTAAGYLAKRYKLLTEAQLKGYLYVSQVDRKIQAEEIAENDNEIFNEDLFMINLPEPEINEPQLSQVLTELHEVAELYAKRLHISTEELLDTNKWDQLAIEYITKQDTLTNNDENTNNMIFTSSMLNNNNNVTINSGGSPSPVKTNSIFSPPPTSRKGKNNNRLSMSQPFFSPRKSIAESKLRRRTTVFSSKLMEESLASPNKSNNDIEIDENDDDNHKNTKLSSLPASPSSLQSFSRRTSDIPNSLDSSPIPLPPSSSSSSSATITDHHIDSLHKRLLSSSNEKFSVTLSPYQSTTTTDNNTIDNPTLPRINIPKSVASTMASTTSYSAASTLQSMGSIDGTIQNNSSSSLLSSSDTTKPVSSSSMTSNISVTIPGSPLSLLPIPLIYILLLIITWFNGTRLSVDI